MSKKKVVFDAYALLNSPEMSAYLDKQEAEQAEQKKRLVAEQEAKQRKTGGQQSRSVSDDELSPEALRRDNISQTTGDITGRANDVWQALKSGGATLIQGAGWLANEAGAHDSGQFLQDIGQIGQEQALANMTQAGREAQKNGVFKEDLSGVNDDWGRGMAQGIAGSAVPSIVGAMLGAPIARGIGAAGEAVLGRAVVSDGALGSVLDAATKYTPAPIMRLTGALPGAAGAGAGEAAVTGATNGAQAYQEVMDAPIESLRKSPAFQSLSKELGSEDAARKAIADRVSIQTAKDTALSTGLIGAAMGGGAVGSLLNKFAVKQGAKEVGKLGAKAAAKEVLKDGAKEFAEEFAQSGPEHYLQNAAKRDYLDPTIDPSTGMLRASLEGGVVGMGQGMGMSGGAHAVNHLLTRNDPQPAKQPQPQPQPAPVATPESVAGYDPIAPNQADLLRRMGVEADPVADAAAASVESVLGAGDPTAGLVASVMRGEALQPIHDMAAVRANTVLPVGSNEGGLYEPQWLPDAEQGESSNGMRMPRRGFDSQEQMLANAGMDARDVQRKADIASQVDAAWAQQQNPVQKARELESLAQESAVPVAIDRAEQSNQINQVLANAAGEGESVPNAMQLALQRAQNQGAAAKPEENTQKTAKSFMTDGASDVVAPQTITSQHGIAHAITEPDQADTAPNISDKAPSIPAPAPNISSDPALTMQQTERGQWLIKGDMAQHAGAIRDALKGMNVLVSPKKGQALVAMPKDKDTSKQAKAIRKALDHLLLNGEQLAQRDAQRAQAGERMQARNKQALQVDHANDDILQAIAKMGGIDTEQALSEWWRGQSETVGHYNAEVPGNLRRQGAFAFKRGGQPIDTVIRRLEGEGYLPEGATPNDLLDAIEQRRLHPAGMEEQARREFDARQQEEQANAPGEFQQAYDEGRFADEFTKRELEEETDYFELNRQNREAAEDAAATAEAAELDRLIDNAPVIASKSGPVTEEELDAIFGQQPRNTAAEGTQTDREPAAGRSMEGTESGTATAEAAPEEDGFGLAGYTESDLRREERAAEQQQREVERQRAAADKARQDEETRKEIRRRSEAAADTFTLGGNAEDNLTGQGGLFDAPAESSSEQNADRSPEKVPDLAPNAASSAEMDALKAEMGDAIGELASILGARKNLTPEEESRIIPVMSKIFRIAAKMGFVKFRDAAQHVMSQIRQLAGDEIADKLSIDNLQAGYINIASEIGGDKREALAYDSIEQLEKDKDHVTDQRSGSDLERNSADATPENGVGAQGVRAGRAGNGRTGRSGVESTQGEVGQRDSIGPDEREAADSGERSDSEVYAGSPIVTPGSAGSRVDIGSTDSGIPGLPVEPQATSQIARVAKSDHRKQLAKDEQREADKHAANASVADALPILTEGQQQDVVKAEARFALPDGYGMLFTNGTGTGKTFTGLGVIKRFVNNGKTNILVVAPNDKIIEDWQRSGKMLGLDLARLANTSEAGKGLVITTYANMGANNALAGRDWDLVVHDEAHYLAMDKDGTNTNALKVLRAISLHHDGAYHRHAMLNADEIALANRLAKEAEMQRTSDNEQEWYLANETQAKADKLANELSKKLDAIKADVASRQGAARTRVVFLSATPFAYEKTIDWANGYLFDYNEGRSNEENSYRGYNQGSNREQFFMQHLGYRMRYGKLTAPDAKVDAGLMQRQFNAYLKKKGSLSGRMLDVKADYDRRFILVDSAIGKRIDDAFEWLRDKSAGTDASATEYRSMIDHLYEKFDYLARRYLLESIKAREVVPHIREHMALGRKVVVFHDYKKGGGFNPFIFSGEMFDHNAVDAFNQEFRDIINSSLFRQSSPIDMFKQEFPDVLLFNGDVPANQRRANVAKFQDDASGPQIILVQSAAGKEGISLHDTTGKHQRVLFNLGQPTQPTTAIQQEGRIYRTGQVTDAIFRYLNTGTNWEKLAFATTIAQRASAAENLGMGEMARALKDAFIAGFEESDNYRAGMEGEGKGGKERDRAANDALTEYDRARSFYFGTQKKNAQTKAKEGKDYFATPEPVGLKMAEFADVRPGESVLEPSAGHGAIARWFPEDANRTAIEPSTALRARLAMVFDGKIIDSDFEGHNIVNKYDAIVMNPPFGVGGKTAVDHLSKAAGHLREGGRVVALLPSGPAADKRLDNFLYGETEREVKPLLEHPTLGPVYRGDTVSTNAAWAKQGVLSRKDRGGGYWLEVKTPSGKSEYQVNPAAWTAVEATGKRKETYRPAGDLSLVADIKLPSVTFERAGTGVMTHIIVLEKGKAGAEADVQQVNRDLAGIDNINDLFKRMENMTLPKRVNAAEPRIQESSSESGAVESSGPEAGASGLDIVEHTTAKGKVLRGVIRTDLTQAQAKEIDPYTFKKDGGYFIRDRYLGQGGTLNSTASHTTTQQRMTQQQLQDLLHKAVPPHLRGMIKVAQSRNAETGGSNTHQSTADEVIDDVEATYDPTTNEITFYADAMDSPERALFVLSHELTHYGLDAKYGFGLSNILLETRNNPMIAKLAAAIAVDRSMTVNSVRQDIADALGVPVARIARSAAIHRLQVETANEALAELNAAIERDDFAYLQERYGVAVPKMMRNDLRGRLARLTASVKAWLAKLTGKQATEYSDKQVWDLLAGVRETVRGGGKLSAGYRDGAAQHSMAASSKTINIDGVTRPTTNSNGKPIAQTEEGLRNFWRWFGDSKVVDKDGKPLVVYHGTESDFDSFDQNKVKTTKLGSGFYFAKDPETANLYAGFSGSNVVPVYLRMERPLIASSVEEARQILEDNGQYMNIDEFSGTHAADMADVLAKAGFDGIMYDGVMVVQNPTQIKSAVGNQGTFNGSAPNILRSTAPKQPASAGFSLPEETKAHATQREVQDNMNRWRQVLENVREQGGQVDEQNDVYGAEERFHGRTATRIEDFARDEVEPLMQRLADSGHSLQDVEQYLLAQHAEEANARIREIDDSRDTAFGMEDGEAQSILAKFAAMPDAAEFKRLANDFRRISEGTLSLYVKAGIVSPEAAHAMRMAYQFYVPVKGGDEDQAARQGTGKGLSVNGKQKRRMGHDMRDEHVLENMLRDRQRAIVLAEKNNVGTYLLDLIERNPDPKLWTVNVLPKQKVLRDQVSYVVELNGQMLDAFNSMEAARVFIQAEAARTGSKPGAFAVSKSSDPYVSMMAKPTLQDHEVQVYVQGRAVRIQLHDPILAGQYRRMGTEQMGRIIEAGKSLNRWLSKVYTGYNPEFFVKNVVRDLFAGTINLTADQGAKVTARALWHWPKAGAAMFKFALTGKAPSGDYGKALQRYRAAGGSTGAAYMGDLERQANTLTELYENYTGAMATLQQGKPFKAARIAGRKLVQGLAHWFEVWNQAGESAFRLATFMAMQESGKTVAESASMAKNVTVNFNRKGELTPQLGALYLFFNPNVQGSQRLWQSLFGGDTKHKAQAWALVGSMAGAALALAMMNRGDDEDEWEAIPDSTKDRNLIIPLGNKRKLTIPLPYGYSFFVSMANRLDALMHGESAEKASIRMASSFFENFSPVGNPIGDDPKLENMLMLLPTAIKIPALPAANITDFGGPMRPDYKETQPDNEKMWRGTRGSLYDKAAQGISSLYGSPYENNWNDISPETIKYLFKTLAGGTGGFMADSASLLNVLASGSAPDVSEVPFLRSAVRESTVKDARARFYDLGKDAKGHVEAWNRAVEAGDDKAATEYEQDGELMALGQMMDGYRKQATALRDLMALEMQREDLTLAEKRMKQKSYESQEAEIYREYIRQFKH